MTDVSPAIPAALQPKVTALFGALRLIVAEHAPVAFANSLGAEDMVLTDALLRAHLDIEIFTLETGRLHPETLDLLDAIRTRYGYEVHLYRPDPDAVADYVHRHGHDAIYESVPLRQRCCHIRKVEPLRRALTGKGAWITGMRRSQSVTRRALPDQEFDNEHGLLKFNPLADWSEHDVWDYIRAVGVPYNTLHDQGYRSIGCAPCTRPTAAGEDIRAGRWWWENEETKECGLHKRPLPSGEHTKAP
ncbi:MAG: phosphoadenylyl-sulfate reductase [Proteobacteria bacterium]|nr:MAG: phosphoadenylyl-sulfate reductase [Pseudomonadota bacterium]